MLRLRYVCRLRPCLGQGVSQGEEAVLADSGREGEIVARVGRVSRSFYGSAEWEIELSG